MYSIIIPNLLSLPEAGSPKQQASQQRLPWSNGSLMAAKLTPTETAGVVQLIIGGHRLSAKVPPSTPMGDMWLQLINREMPAQFRLLSSAQAETLLAKMLQKSAANSTESQTTKQTTEQGWGKLDTASLPFNAEVAVHGQHLTIQDRESGHRDVLLSSTIEGDKFCLVGRVDLERLGPVAFNLHGGDDCDWSLRVFSTNPQLLSYLRAHFNVWLKEEQEKHQNLDGEVLYGMPESMTALAGEAKA
ncbi:hypothetical protein Ga0123461_0154 [Mariprofundus aestuarium]|uniref:Uncharacterized protein n=1 Tax=Mariprofundus aestuarium TaxID=1921086 RepID=A0A2K8KV23_MARES|nr:hypothetical protein [Mariprofundus aestuarium]ATX78607.1 hypothetical protein Ga0123461_0154 [Mariprofundus aestuarium]